MNKPLLWYLALLSLLIFLFWLVYAAYLGIVTPPSEGDSLIIHIPAAKKILEGTIFALDIKNDLFYPSSIELILAAFIFIKIPLGLFNVFGVGILFVSVYLLGATLLKDKAYSIVFATSVALMHGVIRWTLTQKIDIYMLAFFVFFLWLLFMKKKGIWTYFFLGVTGGFFTGAKFNGPVYLFITVLPFLKLLKSTLTLHKFIAFIIPFMLIGPSWFIRNILIAGDPFYFPDYSSTVQNFSITSYIFYAYIYQPFIIFDAYISEYMIWSFGLVLIPLYFLGNHIRKIKNDSLILKLFAISFVIFLLSLAYPYRELLHQIIGTMRYTLPMIFLIILCIFLIFKKHKLETLLSLWVIPTIFVSLIPDYHPKILLIIVPIITIVYFLSITLKKIRL